MKRQVATQKPDRQAASDDFRGLILRTRGFLFGYDYSKARFCQNDPFFTIWSARLQFTLSFQSSLMQERHAHFFTPSPSFPFSTCDPTTTPRPLLPSIAERLKKKRRYATASDQ